MSQAELAPRVGCEPTRDRGARRGRSSVSDADLHTLADACGVEIGVLAPPKFRLAVAAHALSDQGRLARGDAARDVLLREYVAMLVELRGATNVPTSSLRQDDLAELARVVGGTPEAIDARLTELLEATDVRVQTGS